MNADSVNLAWLAAVVDGEGSIGAYITKTTQRHNNIKYDSVHVVYQFTVANTNTILIEEVHRIVSDILGKDTPITAIQVVADKRPERKNTRIGYCVNVKDHRGIVRILSALEPYLVGKKSQAQVMLNLLMNHRWHGKYTKVELQVIELLKTMKKHNTAPNDGNAEPSLVPNGARKCVENIQATTQIKMFELKTCSDTP